MDFTSMIKRLPKKPGVYLFKGAGSVVIYIGKAKDIQARVKNYFQRSSDERPQIAFLMKRIRDIEFIVTDSEKEAFLLENTLIKRHRPRYNLDLKDDKSYVSIRIGSDHEFPGIMLTRKVKKDGALYFGPYDSAQSAREAVEQMTRFFKIRSCKDAEFANRVRPCLKHDIGRCTAPCVKLVTKEEYEGQVEEAEMFLSGRKKELVERLEGRMREASSAMRYEDAATIRDAIELLNDAIAKQDVVRHGGGDIDVVGMARRAGLISICILEVRGGLLIGNRAFHSKDQAGDDDDVLGEFVMGHYSDLASLPPLVYSRLSAKPRAVLCAIFAEAAPRRAAFASPQRGHGKRLLTLAEKNASEALEYRLRRAGGVDGDMPERLGAIFGLASPVRLIDCIDISNLAGQDAVGSAVSFFDGEPDKKRYRIYNIRTILGSDDYAMMKEVVERRYGHGVDMGLPDLVLLDGGKGQLMIGERALADLGVDVRVAAIAKGRKDGEIDRVFVPGRKNPLNLRRGSKELLFLMRIRDEAHRFGINAHRKRHGRRALGKD
jgi:excinuclease ABC subunit C